MSYTQKSLEQYFQEHQITDSDKKATLLSKITDLIYDRNMHVVEWEKTQDAYKKKQIEEGIEELEHTIRKQMNNNL